MKALGICTALALSCAASGIAHAEISGDVVRVGVLTTSPASFRTPTAWARWKPRAWRRRILPAAARTSRSRSSIDDHQNKADVRLGHCAKVARVDGVDAIVDVPNSAVGLTINSLVRDKQDDVSGVIDREFRPSPARLVRPTPFNGSTISGRPANATAAAMMDAAARNGFFVTVNFALGQGNRGLRPPTTSKTWRQGAGIGQAPAQYLGFRLALAAGAEFQGKSDRACQRRRRHHQRGEAGPPNSVSSRAPDHGGVPAVRQRRPRHGIEGSPGSANAGSLLLGHERRHASLSQKRLRRGRA